MKEVKRGRVRMGGRRPAGGGGGLKVREKEKERAVNDAIEIG